MDVGGEANVKDDKEDQKKQYDVDATLCWGPLIFGMMLGGSLGRGRGGPVMMRPGPGMGPYLNTTVPGVRRPGMGGPMVGPKMPGTGVGPGMVNPQYPGAVRRYPMY